MSRRHPPTPSSLRRRGFTLAELILVMVILALAAALVIPQAISTSSMTAQAAARLIMADLEYAQSQAILAQAAVTVSFDLPGNSYTVSNASGTLVHPITKKAYVVDLDTQRGLEGATLETVSFDGAQQVSFDSLGAPDLAGTVTLSAGPHRYRVTVAAVSGRVSVEVVP